MTTFLYLAVIEIDITNQLNIVTNHELARFSILPDLVHCSESTNIDTSDIANMICKNMQILGFYVTPQPFKTENLQLKELK